MCIQVLSWHFMRFLTYMKNKDYTCSQVRTDLLQVTWYTHVPLCICVIVPGWIGHQLRCCVWPTAASGTTPSKLDGGGRILCVKVMSLSDCAVVFIRCNVQTGQPQKALYQWPSCVWIHGSICLMPSWRQFLPSKWHSVFCDVIHLSPQSMLMPAVLPLCNSSAHVHKLC